MKTRRQHPGTRASSAAETPTGKISDLLAIDDAQEQIAQLSCDVLNRLYVLTRNSLLFDTKNDALNRPVAAFMETLKQLEELNEQKASIGVVGDNLFLNQNLLKPDPGTYANGQFLGRIFQRLNAQEFQFDTSCKEGDVRNFIAMLRKTVAGEKDLASLAELPGFKMIPLSGNVTAGHQDVEIDARIQVLRVYASSISIMTRVMLLAIHGLPWNPSMIRRVAYDLSDAAVRQGDLLLGLINLRLPKCRLGVHLVRVAILAYLCAEKLKLQRKAKAEIALIALYHHMIRPGSKTELAEADLPLDEELPINRVDQLEAAIALCITNGLNEALIRRVVSVYEATGAANGQKQLYQASEPHDLLGRIIFLADRFANLMDALPPDEALRVLLHEHQQAEPELTQIVVNAIGLYPVGTLVELESGARAVVVEAPRRREQLLRPVVRIIDGDETALVDLSRDTRHGKIVGTTSADQIGVNVSHYFLL